MQHSLALAKAAMEKPQKMSVPCSNLLKEAILYNNPEGNPFKMENEIVNYKIYKLFVIACSVVCI